MNKCEKSRVDLDDSSINNANTPKSEDENSKVKNGNKKDAIFRSACSGMFVLLGASCKVKDQIMSPVCQRKTCVIRRHVIE